jgi:hexosaminidase
MKKMIIFFGFFSMTLMLQAQNRYHVIPFPNKLVEAEGVFECKAVLTITIPDAFKSEMKLMTAIFADEYYIKLVPSANGRLVLRQNNQLGKEDYTLNVSKEKIIAEASSTTGCFWAFQTIRQLMSLTGNGSYTIAECQIEDHPAYPWRAFMLDEARIFKGKRAVKVLLDQMALLKMNVFHWHLTDDQGWRIEIHKYPLLTEIGAWRDSSQITTAETGWTGHNYDPKPQGGFYTQADIKELVSYATQRHITIVPEIDLPGHSVAAIAAYPWLGTNEEAMRVWCSVGDITLGTLNIADDKVFQFIEDVMDEIIQLFPGNVIHCGGDEVDYGPWQKSETANILMKKNGFTNYSDLQMYFSNRLAGFLEKKGRRMMGWNEIMGKNIHPTLWKVDDASQTLSKSVIIHFWEGNPIQIKEAMENDYDVVNSDRLFSYLHYTYRDLPLEKAYNFLPTPKDVNPQLAKHILGPECAMWGERLFKLSDLYQQVFPRLAAYAEVGWTTESNKNFARFDQSLKELKRAWDFIGITYYEKY